MNKNIWDKFSPSGPFSRQIEIIISAIIVALVLLLFGNNTLSLFVAFAALVLAGYNVHKVLTKIRDLHLTNISLFIKCFNRFSNDEKQAVFTKLFSDLIESKNLTWYNLVLLGHMKVSIGDFTTKDVSAEILAERYYERYLKSIEENDSSLMKDVVYFHVRGDTPPEYKEFKDKFLEFGKNFDDLAYSFKI